MKISACILWLIISAALTTAQEPPQKTAPPPATTPSNTAPNFSGMYSFLKEGEFVQLTVEEGRVTGFISRYGDHETDRGVFLDHFFKDGKLDGNKLSFTTKTVHSAWYEFAGTVERGEGKSPGDEAYYVLKGKLTTHTQDAAGKDSTSSREVAFKSFPGDVEQ